jgi:hypothetical protein
MTAPPRLLLTIDVEEDMPDWKITDPITTANAEALPRLQEMCDALGVKPTYLCTHPMVTQSVPSRILGELARAGRCEIGAHLHPWNTPPYLGIPGVDADERTIPYYMSRLGPERFAKKLATLTTAVADLVGKAPVSFRAGRYGLDAATCAVLPQYGYTTDTSVTPLASHAADGGPDFRGAPEVPYYPSREDLCVPGDLPIVEIPVSVSLTRNVPRAVRLAYVRIPAATRIRGILSRDFLGIVDYAWLYPARFDLGEMTAAARSLHAAGHPFLNVFLHSSELIPGASQLVRTREDADRCVARLRGILDHCIRELGAVPATLEEGGRAAREWIAARGAAR